MGLLRSLRRRWIRKFGPAHVRRHLAQYDRWVADQADARRYSFPDLVGGAIVVDLGGFKGEWSARMLELYDVRVHVFEPHPKFASDLERRFSGDDRVTVHPVALASKDGELRLTDDADASRAEEDGEVVGKCAEASSYLASVGISRVDLMKINIEGGEYDILPHLMDIDLMEDIGIIQVQFHAFSPEDEARRDAVVNRLQRTHVQTWAYPFVWEEWRLRTA